MSISSQATLLQKKLTFTKMYVKFIIFEIIKIYLFLTHVLLQIIADNILFTQKKIELAFAILIWGIVKMD